MHIKDLPRAEPVDVTIIGAGLREYDHLTPEAQRAVDGARILFYSPYNGKPVDLGSEHTAELRDIEEGEYRFGSYRPDMYRRMAERVVQAAAESPGVVLMQPGSAVVVDTVTQWTLALAAQRGLRALIVPGVSCVEIVLGALGYDLAEGIQIVTAQHLVLRRLRLSRQLATLIIQPGYYDTLWWAGVARSRPDRFVELQRTLETIYPKDTELALILAPVRADRAGSEFWLRLGNLACAHPVLSPFHTMFIPAIEDVEPDLEFQRRIESWEASVGVIEHQDSRVAQRPLDAFRPEAAGLPDALVAESHEIAGRQAELRRLRVGPDGASPPPSRRRTTP